MHRARAILQAAFYDYPVDDLYSLIFGEKEEIGTEFIKGMGLAVSVRDEDTNMASCELDVSRLGLHNGDIFGNCFDKAGEFARDVFESGGLLKIQQNHLLKWRGITRLIGEELLTTAYVAKHNVRTEFCWQDVQEVDCPWLDSVLRDGVCDIHSHLNASYDSYLINWIGLMNQIAGKAYFFDRPIPAGTAVYSQVGASSGPGPARSWAPAEALSTGPMLLYGGKVCVSEDRISTGVYYTNYELWSTASGDIYGSARPRTALGFNSESGKMYLVVVTSGITLTGMARVMKGLGCDYAMNLDGGGSTQMQVSGQGELTKNQRSVKSTAGFFAR